MAPPFRADQVGSLLRPQSLVEARKNSNLQGARLRNGPVAQGEDDAAANLTAGSSSNEADPIEVLRSEQAKAIKDVVGEQLSRHILPITTGEYERGIFYGNFFESLSGFEVRYTPMADFKVDFPTNRPLIKWGLPGRDAGFPTSNKVTLERSAYLDDWLYLRSLLPEERWRDAKMTVPPPGWWHIQLKEPFDRSLYENDEALLRDLSAAVRKEILTLYEHGLRVVQVDDPNLSFFCDEEWIQACQKEGVDLERLLELYITSHNDAIKDLPSDLHVGIHICRGNFPNGVGLASGSYERIARKLFNETSYKLFYLEFDSPRAGDFTPLKYLPSDKAVVLGVVTTKSAEMEDLDELKKRVYQAADVVAEGQGNERTREDALRDNLAVSPQCGFASDHSEGGVGMTRERMWEKLELVKRLSEEIWPGWDKDRK
ncbi:Cobalamin-independent synthase, Catalytic domain-containing protein [Cladophialophora immunda]|nr:Cobalamin-independent synthase, Catalytic domain-containing protein [Cladophialophora immunda]